MKKIYLSFLALSVAGVTFGQSAVKNTIPFKTQAETTIKSTNLAPQDKGTVIWSDNFDTPSNWTATAVVAPDNWSIGTAVPSGAYAINGLTSTSGGNFALFDSDLMCSGSQDATLTINTPVNLTGYNNVSLEFEQYYRKYQCTTYIGVSTNGGSTWTDIEVNANIGVNDFNDNNSGSNPNSQSVNISSVAANQASVLIRFRFVGGCDYAWMVDDVKITETENNDLVANEGYYGTAGIPYTRIPVNQIQPIDFFMKVGNVGAVNQTNTIMTANVNAGSVGTSVPQTVLAGASDDSLGMNAVWTPPTTTGVPYTLDVTASSDSTDATPVNNTIAFAPLEVHSSQYAVDNYGVPGIGNGGGYNTNATPPTEEFEAGNWFDIFANDNANSIEVVVGSNSGAGAIIDAAIYDISSGNFVEVPGSRTAPYSITAGDASGNATIILPFSAPVALVPGSYFVCVHAWGGAGAEFYYGVSGSSLSGQGFGAQQSLIFYPNMPTPNSGENFYTTATPMVRLNLDAATEVAEANIEDFKFNVYPNPSATGDFTINLNSATTENVNLTVTNVVGQTIVNRTVAVSGQTKETISLANQSKGVYFLTVNNETIKLIVK